MQVNFDANKTMKMIGYSKLTDADSPDGKAVTNILDGLGLPVTSENVLLATYSMAMGHIIERREQRQRKHTA